MASFVVQSFDLRSPSTPKSLCVFKAPPDTANPFDSATEEAVVFGTDRGSFHYRCYNLEGDGRASESSKNHQPINQGKLVNGSINVILQLAPTVFFVLYEDNKSVADKQPSTTFASQLVAMRHQSFQFIPVKTPRMSCAAYHPALGIVYASGKQVANLSHESLINKNSTNHNIKPFNFPSILPGAGARSGPDAIQIICQGQTVVAAVGSTLYAIDVASGGLTQKICNFQATSSVHPMIIRDIADESTDWSVLVCAAGRECCIVDVWSSSVDSNAVTAIPRSTPPVTTPSPILNVCPLAPWIAILTADGLLSMRSPSCLAIALRTIEVGRRQNDFFTLARISQHYIASLSLGGECLVIKCPPDTKQDLADRLMRLSIDAFGANGFPRSQVAQAVNASFTATSYVGPEANAASRALLKQYLEAVLQLADFVSNAKSTWPGSEGNTPILSATALLCLACTFDVQNATLANRAASQACENLEIRFASHNHPQTLVCVSVAEKLIREASQSIDLLKAKPAISSSGNKSNVHVEFIEAAVSLLRACGQHEQALQIFEEKLRSSREASWSQIKYESYIATYLSELWVHERGREMVLNLPAMSQLLESNPPLGLSVFTSSHPSNRGQWKKMLPREEPLRQMANEVVGLLKTVQPLLQEDDVNPDQQSLPLDSGRALAVSYLESAFGVNTGRPREDTAYDSLPMDQGLEEMTVALHDEFTILCLEGIISGRGDDDNGEDTPLGKIYRRKLRNLLRWPLAKLRSDRLLSSLPSSFREERALLLGRLGRHEDALRILYVDCKSLDLAIAYCDARHEFKKPNEGCSYLPLIRVALEADPDPTQSSAIQVLAMRSNAIDRAAALRLLPKSVPVSAVARPFLIPALVDSESEIRRLTVVANLLRARYTSLKHKVTESQIKAQSTLQGVPQLRSLQLGDPLHSTKANKIRPNQSASSTFPDIAVIKHFFPRHLVIQSKVTNSAASVQGRTLGDITFVVAESSDEAIQPVLQVPLKQLPFNSTGSSWCVLAANPRRMETVAVLTCELRYVVSSVEAAGAGLGYGAVTGRMYVEELSEMEVHAAHFT